MFRNYIIKASIIATFVIVFLFNTSYVIAGTFQLTKIGAMNATGIVLDKWYYTGSQPTFAGTGIAGETVNIVLDSEPFSTTVDTDNNWSWTPESALATGDHYISFASSDSSIGFDLVIGSEIPEGISAPEPLETPVAGMITPTLLFSSLGTSLLGASLYLKRKT